MEKRASPDYILGHSPQEIRRLELQASRIDPITRRFFAAAGVSAGDRVLDVGSGAGDVSFLTKQLVGEGGTVLGVDRSATAIDAAQRRLSEARMSGVSFAVGDPGEMQFAKPFDAVVGRYVLQFQTDPSALLRRLARHVRPGGLIVFHELDWGGVQSFPPVELFSRCSAWGRSALEHGGAETRMGSRLHASFHSAGLGAPNMLLEALAGGGAKAAPIVASMAGIIETLLPAIERAGLATAEEVDARTLAERIQREVDAAQAVLIGHFQFAAWVRV